MKSIYRLTVRGYEIDAFGHVNNAVYLQYAEAAKWEFFQENGLTEEMKAEGCYPVVMENHLRYLHELCLYDRVLVETDWKCTGGIVHFTHNIKNETTGQTACKVKGKLVYVDSMRIICDVPAQIRAFMERETIEENSN